MDGVEYTYYYMGDKLARLTVGDSLTMDFFYDQNGQPYAMKYNNTMLYYVLNQQGDVTRLVSASGESYGIYRYDAWGNILYNTDNQWLNNNPLRYRGYVYDTETELYYCQSRYYDPAVGRFINADSFASTGQGILGNNMFAYCLNNPVNRSDSTGALGVLFWSFVGVVGISAAANAISTWINGGSAEECLWAALAGAGGAAAGFGVSMAMGFSPQGNIAGRATATLISDLGTAWLTNGELTTNDFTQAGVDVVMDMCYSTVGYYYTMPIKNGVVQNYVNAGLDGLTDVVETYLFYGSDNAESSYSISKPNGLGTVGGRFKYAAILH